MDGTRIKKDEIVGYALDQCGINELDSAIMVGDRKYDIFGAKEVGIDSIGVLYGYGSYEELESAGATMIVETVEELGKALMFGGFGVDNQCKPPIYRRFIAIGF